jgi:4-diphosphocytidyl-2-C-methyl-D-erythritol kinase
MIGRHGRIFCCLPCGSFPILPEITAKKRKMRLFSPAKINLFLHILGKRPDGFHELETLMAPLELADEIELSLEKAPGIRLGVEGADLPTGPENLAWRAADAVLRRAAPKISETGLSMLLRKHIPHGGGMGGGSSNAALVLKGVNDLLGQPLSPAELQEEAADLGSDVPFFLGSGAAMCRGRGERIEPVPLQAPPWVLLANPGFGVPTPWAYKAYASAPAQGEPGRGTYTQGGRPFRLRNDLEPPVFAKYLWIAECKRWLLDQKETCEALMSGSGATVFALFETEAAARDVTTRARAQFGPETLLLPTRLAGTN